jgi:hypothetical protein
MFGKKIDNKIPIVGPEIPTFKESEFEEELNDGQVSNGEFREVNDDVVEEPLAEESQNRTKTMPKEPKRPVSNNGNGNGHKDAEEIVNSKPVIMVNQDDEEDLYNVEEERTKLPGEGFMFGVKPQHLKEATRLNDREIGCLAVGYVQDAVLKKGRKMSVFETYATTLMQLKISQNGVGRDEFTTLTQLSAEEKAEKNGDLFAGR